MKPYKDTQKPKMKYQDVSALSIAFVLMDS